MAQMEKTTVYLPADLERELKEAARREGRPAAQIVRDAIRGYLDRSPHPDLSFIGSGEDADLDARDSETWLRRQWAGR